MSGACLLSIHTLDNDADETTNNSGKQSHRRRHSRKSLMQTLSITGTRTNQPYDDEEQQFPTTKRRHSRIGSRRLRSPDMTTSTHGDLVVVVVVVAAAASSHRLRVHSAFFVRLLIETQIIVRRRQSFVVLEYSC
jgi:hypothetical protein